MYVLLSFETKSRNYMKIRANVFLTACVCPLLLATEFFFPAATGGRKCQKWLNSTHCSSGTITAHYTPKKTDKHLHIADNCGLT